MTRLRLTLMFAGLGAFAVGFTWLAFTIGEVQAHAQLREDALRRARGSQEIHVSSMIMQSTPVSDVLACIGSKENPTEVTAAYAFIRTIFPQGSASELEALQLDLQGTVAGKVRQYRDQRAAEVQALDAVMTPSERQAIQQILEAARKRSQPR